MRIPGCRDNGGACCYDPLPGGSSSATKQLRQLREVYSCETVADLFWEYQADLHAPDRDSFLSLIDSDVDTNPLVAELDMECIRRRVAASAHRVSGVQLLEIIHLCATQERS